MAVNELLSHWDAWHTCYCGRWQFQPSPAQSEVGVAYERAEKRVRVFAHVTGVTVCEVCGYDLTRTPEANLKAIPAEEWEKGEIVGSDFSSPDVVDFLPNGSKITFARCNLDNVTLGGTHTMTGKSVHWQGVVCSHNRVARQNDGQHWLCRWNASGGHAKDSPVEPINLKRAMVEGRNTDPALIPAKPLTDTAITEERRARERWQSRVENARTYIEQDGWVECSCLSERRATVHGRFAGVPDRKVLPDRKCPLCGGCGAVPGGDR